MEIDRSPSRIKGLPGWIATVIADWRVLLCLILLAAAALRVDGIHEPLTDRFSWRESSTAMMADNFELRNPNILFPEVSWSGPGLSYQGREFQVVSWTTAQLYRVFGWHDWFGRLVAASFGILGIFSLHQLIARVWDEPHALAGAMMMAILPGAILIDRSFLPDPAMLGLVLAGSWMFVAWLQTDRMWRLAAAVLLLTLGVLAKSPGAAVVAPLGYAAAVILRRSGGVWRRKLLLLGAAAVAVIVPVVAYYRWAAYLGRTYPPYHMAGHGFAWDSLVGFVQHDFYAHEALHHATWLLTLPVILLAGVGLLARPPQGPSGARWFFHAWLAGAGVIFLLAAEELTNNPWNFLIFLPPAAVFAGAALLAIGRMGQPVTSLAGWARGAVVVLVVLWGWFSHTGQMRQPVHQNAYALGMKLKALSGPSDLVITAPTEAGNPVSIYYSRHRGWLHPAGGGSRDWTLFIDDPKAIAEVRALRAHGARWFGATKDARDREGHLLTEHNPQLIAYLDQTARRVVDDPVMTIWRLSPPVGQGVAPH